MLSNPRRFALDLLLGDLILAEPGLVLEDGPRLPDRETPHASKHVLFAEIDEDQVFKLKIAEINILSGGASVLDLVAMAAGVGSIGTRLAATVGQTEVQLPCCVKLGDEVGGYVPTKNPPESCDGRENGIEGVAMVFVHSHWHRLPYDALARHSSPEWT